MEIRSEFVKRISEINSFYEILRIIEFEKPKISGFNIDETSLEDFNSIVEDTNLPKIGVVGEIFLKFNSFAHKDILTWLTDRKLEVVPPMLSDFFFQSFVNSKIRKEEKIEQNRICSSRNCRIYIYFI